MPEFGNGRFSKDQMLSSDRPNVVRQSTWVPGFLWEVSYDIQDEALYQCPFFYRESEHRFIVFSPTVKYEISNELQDKAIKNHGFGK
ncbi:unnamed protein product [Schistosoma curassoni]|uniref:Myotubularin phosphatase domain-containing protein n=1 Tax=Schistosoma curassoni TaxID=6186 RepID=A0A183KBP9_9TREM|nr:unnamed protein product [Schistosoma curassoni]